MSCIFQVHLEIASKLAAEKLHKNFTYGPHVVHGYCVKYVAKLYNDCNTLYWLRVARERVYNPWITPGLPVLLVFWGTLPQECGEGGRGGGNPRITRDCLAFWDTGVLGGRGGGNSRIIPRTASVTQAFWDALPQGCCVGSSSEFQLS